MPSPCPSGRFGKHRKHYTEPFAGTAIINTPCVGARHPVFRAVRARQLGWDVLDIGKGSTQLPRPYKSGWFGRRLIRGAENTCNVNHYQRYQE